MTQKLHALHAEAAAAHAKVQALPYDPLDTAETGFVADCAAYNATMQELERRLAAIVSQARIPAYPERFLAVGIIRPYSTSRKVGPQVAG
jgi:hypothetical protein